jgi:glycosyltransferase involved in cell wall biosynthesis
VRIVQVYKDYYPPTVGGMEQTVERLAVQMVRRGADVTVLTSHPGARETIEETIQGVRVIRCGEWTRVLSTPFCPDMPRQMAALEADVWHLHYPSPPGEVSWVLTKPRGALVVTWHGEVIKQRFAMPVYRHVVRQVLRDAVVVTQSYEGQVQQSPFRRELEAKTTLVPLGIDLEPFERRPEHDARGAELRARFGGPLVVFVGRLVGFKGVHVLVEAMRKVDGRLVVVGDGPERGRLEAQAARRGLGDRVTFTGRVEPSEVPYYLAAADVGVLPSVAPQETFGLSMVEMMVFGLPVVCTDLGTGTSFVNRHGESGLLVPPRDPAALAEALGRILHDDALRVRLGQGARQRAHQWFSTEAMMARMAEVYERALAQPAAQAV